MRLLEQREELVDAHLRVANETSECADRKLRVLGNREIGSRAGFAQDDMAADLTNERPAGLLKGFEGLFARDISKTCHRLHRHHNPMLTLGGRL